MFVWFVCFVLCFQQTNQLTKLLFKALKHHLWGNQAAPMNAFPRTSSDQTHHCHALSAIQSRHLLPCHHHHQYKARPPLLTLLVESSARCRCCVCHSLTVFSLKHHGFLLEREGSNQFYNDAINSIMMQSS